MRCSGCGKDVPFSGEVCPFCLRDKKSDQAGSVAAGIGLIVGELLGNLVAGFTGMIIGGFALGVIAMTIALSGSKHSAKKPPRVRVVTHPAAKMKAASQRQTLTGADDRLRQLQALKSEGLISDAEFQQKRAAIVAAL